MDNIENVYQAFDCLSSQNIQQRHEADRWLLEFQKSVSLIEEFYPFFKTLFYLGLCLVNV